MRKYTLIMIIVALLCCFSVAPSASAASDEDQILQLVSDYFKAWNTNDNELMA